jgi:hypothetical protein
MNLEEQCALMKEHYDKGHFIVRLHTGDPCIFGAIQEQMAFFDREGMHYHITPGISSFLAAAAELRSQFTIPERTQTIILTRGEGRTPMPEREKLHLLARSRSTMCIFLSAAIEKHILTSGYFIIYMYVPDGIEDKSLCYKRFKSFYCCGISSGDFACAFIFICKTNSFNKENCSCHLFLLSEY